jgi:hypothetical protein
MQIVKLCKKYAALTRIGWQKKAQMAGYLTGVHGNDGRLGWVRHARKKCPAVIGRPF